jgi:hypothetical protein
VNHADLVDALRRWIPNRGDRVSQNPGDAGGSRNANGAANPPAKAALAKA